MDAKSDFLSAHSGENVTISECGAAVELVGHDVQPFEGGQRESNGWVVRMWSYRDDLTLHRRHDDYTEQEFFKITSVVRVIP
jgi:hypothetical protein